MKKTNRKKLILAHETLRTLSDSESLLVAGGMAASYDIGESCFYNQCRLTDAASLAGTGVLKTCWC